MQHLAMSRRPKTVSEAWLNATGFREPVHHSNERLFDEWTKFRDRYKVDATKLTGVGRKYLGVDFEFPDPPILDCNVASLNYDEARDVVCKAVLATLSKARREFDRCKVGTITFGDDGQSARFQFHEVYRRKGLFREFVSRTPHEHQLVRTRVRRVDDKDVKLPAVAQGIVNDLSPGLRRELRVVVGTEVVRQSGEEEIRKELTPLGRALVGAGKGAAKAVVTAAPVVAGVAAAGILGTAAAIGAGLLMSAVFVADPALVLGDICLFGWED